MPTAKPPAYLIYMDRYHMGDPLFVKELAERLAGPPGEVPRCLLLHGSGEKVERTLEAEGLFPERVDGVLQVEDPAQQRLVERAAREANQELVGTLTDEVVSAVGAQGTSRNLLRFTEAGTVEVGRAAWVEDLIKLRVVPVVSALAKTAGGGTREAPPAAAACALAEALGGLDVTVVFFTQNARPGLTGDGADMLGSVEAAALEAHAAALPEPEAARRVAERGLPVLFTSVAGLFSAPPQGTRLTS